MTFTKAERQAFTEIMQSFDSGLVMSAVALRPFWEPNDGTPGRLVMASRFVVGPWASCARCGGQTRCNSGGVFKRPIHMLCQRVSVRAPRIEPNRHDRRRMGLPRPMAPEWVDDWVVND